MRYVIGVLVLSMLLLTACGGTQVTTSGTDVNVNTPGANVTANTNGADVNTNGANVAANAGGAAAGTTGGKTLGDILKAVSGRQFKVSYDVTAGSMTTQMTEEFKGTDFAVLSSVNGIDSKMIYDGTNIIACTKQAQWTCMKIAKSTQPMGTLDTEKSISASDMTKTPTGTCSRAGETGVAYDVTTQGNTAHICYTLDGIPLEMTTTAGGVATSMLATSISGSVDDSEFVPPATPQDLSALAAQYQH